MSTKYHFIIVLFLLISCKKKTDIEYQITNQHSWLFLNLENSMNITLQNTPNEQIKIITNQGHVVIPDNEGNFRLKPNIRSTLKAKVYKYEKQDSFLIHERNFSVKTLPKATTLFANEFDSKITMSKNKFLSQKGIRAEVLNYDYDINTPIESYSIIIIRNNTKLIYLEDCTGGLLNENTKNKIDGLLMENDRIILTNIKTKSNYHLNKYINSIEIVVKK